MYNPMVNRSDMSGNKMDQSAQLMRLLQMVNEGQGGGMKGDRPNYPAAPPPPAGPAGFYQPSWGTLFEPIQSRADAIAQESNQAYIDLMERRRREEAEAGHRPPVTSPLDLIRRGLGRLMGRPEPPPPEPRQQYAERASRTAPNPGMSPDQRGLLQGLLTLAAGGQFLANRRAARNESGGTFFDRTEPTHTGLF